MARRTTQPRGDVTWAVLVTGAAATGAAAYFGAPPAVAAWLAVTVAAWLAVEPQLTGRKKSGRPQPDGPVEERKLATWATWSQLRWRLVFPSEDWLPGWPPLASWAAGAVTGAVFWLWPVRNFPQWHLEMATERLADAIAAWWLVVSVTSARRQAAGPGRPATRADAALARAFLRSPVGFVASAGIAASIGATVGWAAEHGLAAYHHWAATWAVDHPHKVPPPGWAVVSPHPGLAVALLAVAGGLAGIGWAWHEEATGRWRKVSAAAAEWEERWESLKVDPAPVLVDHRELGPVTIWTFDAPPGLGSMWALSRARQIAPTLGAGLMVAVLEAQDLNGSVHPIRFDVAAWSELPDFKSPALDAELAALAAHSCFAWATESAGYGRPVPLVVERANPGGTQGAVWASKWAWPNGPSLVEIRAITDRLEASFRCEVLIDHRGGSVFFGDMGADGIPDNLARHISDMRVERVWEKRWSQIPRAKDHPPVVRPETTASATLPDGTEVHRQAFVARQGIDPDEFRGLEPKLATAIQGAPYVAVCGWPAAGGRPGDRHPQAIVVYWSIAPVPTSPERLESSPASPWILAGLANKAFDAAKLPRPELAAAKELTAPGEDDHIWAIKLRLYGGVTVSDVIARAGRLQQALQASWLRVTATSEPDLVSVYAGAEPGSVDLAGGEKARDLLLALDWEQAWLDSGVVGAAGGPPRLVATDVMPHNSQVSVLDFSLPPGTGSMSVHGALDKLRAATGNAFVQDTASPLGADAVRLLVSREVPLPKSAPLDWDAVRGAGPLAVPMGTGVDGEPVTFDVATTAHLLVVGATGSGKSTLLRTLVYGWLVKGAQVVVVDPVKGCADFAFAKGHTAQALDVAMAKDLLVAVYEEVARRKRAIIDAGGSSWLDLPEPPPPLVVVIDEFTSVLIPSATPKKTGDPELDIEVEEAEAENRARLQIGILVSKLAREARWSGAVLVLATQKLAASTLEQIPGKDLKTNLGRALIGQASYGDRASALRAPQEAPQLSGEIPPGRGLYEPIDRTASIVQFWHASTAELRERLYEAVPSPAPLRLAGPALVDVGEMELTLDDIA